MNTLKHAVIVTALIAATALPTMGGGGMGGMGAAVSPHETISLTNVGNLIKITYGRPFSKDPKNPATIRKIWGTLVPWEQPWRLGADQATTLVIEKAIVLGGTNIPAGTYTLYMVPSEKGVSKLAICKKTGQWGIPVDVADDLARVDLMKAPLATQLDQLTISFAPPVLGRKPAAGDGFLKIQWEKTEYSVEFYNAP